MNNFTDIFNNWCAYEKEVRNHNSWKYRHYMVRSFWRWLISTKGNLPIEQIELSDIIGYLVYYRTTPTAPKGNHSWKFPSRNAEYWVICAIRTFFKFCCMMWIRLKFNWEQIPMFKPDEAKREPMSEEDYYMLHRAIKKYAKTEEIKLRNELLIEIPWETGLRRAEIVRLRFADFHNANRQCRVLVKGNRYEAVFYSKALQKKVLRYEQLLNEKYKHLDIEYLFICLGQKDKGKIMTSDLLSHKFRKLIRKMESDGLIPVGKRLCLHMERHSFAMRCVYSGLSQQATTALMRHKDPKVTLHYYHMSDAWLLNQYDLIK